ncbi:serine hydrolase [Nocardiopsis sp. TSRI0078]|uniref:serine hydrolase n=1 Tax=unclassified Nocardiopsis TaxID=2649073 RepID=UPI00093DE7CF|nr:serine hydrolase [Nocardiopsis sp. TSRI0078]OKI12382.1 serine hydrolase [Nocardiopsis sp. TSRI0078]
MNTTSAPAVRVHAREVDGTGQVGHGAEDPVVLASVAKVLIVLEFARQASTGLVDPTERVVVRRDARLGGWGTADFADDVELSLRDCALLAMTISDNTAADLIVDRVGVEPVQLLAAELGLERTRFTGGPRALLHALLDESDATGTDPAVLLARDPSRTTSSTLADITRLLQLVWTDAAAPPRACAFVRDLMARQLVRTRIASGFGPDVRVGVKSGTLPGLRMEAGVVEYPDGGRYAVAVCAVGPDPDRTALEADMALGRAAREAVERLRVRFRTAGGTSARC